MVLYPVVWVCAVVLHSLGRAEKVAQMTEPGFSENTEGSIAGTVTIGPDEIPEDDDLDYGEVHQRVYQRDSQGVIQLVETEGAEDTYNDPCNLSYSELPCCIIYPTNQLNCSWKFHGLPNDSQSSASVSVCRRTERISSADCVSEVMGAQGWTGNADGVVRDVYAGSVDDSATTLILTFNVSRPDLWCIYTHKLDTRDIEVLRPPPNVTAWFREEGLLVQWGLPSSRSKTTSLSCFHYQLQFNDLVRNFTEGLTYTETNPDRTQSYDVKMRVMKSHTCRGSQHWSRWSNTITVAPSESPNQLNSLGVIGIALGVPMILLALVILIRLQRECLFPPIPGPPLKIKHTLERDNLFQFVPQALPSKCVEEITEVEEAEETPVNMACLK